MPNSQSVQFLVYLCTTAWACRNCLFIFRHIHFVSIWLLSAWPRFAFEEITNCNCAVFFTYSVTVFQLQLELQLLDIFQLLMQFTDFSVFTELQLLLTGIILGPRYFCFIVCTCIIQDCSRVWRGAFLFKVLHLTIFCRDTLHQRRGMHISTMGPITAICIIWSQVCSTFWS